MVCQNDSICNLIRFLSVCLSLLLGSRLSVCLSRWHCVCLSVSLPLLDRVCLSVHLYVSLSGIASVCLSLSLSWSVSVCLSVCLSLSLRSRLAVRLSISRSGIVPDLCFVCKNDSICNLIVFSGDYRPERLTSPPWYIYWIVHYSTHVAQACRKPVSFKSI